MNKCGYLLPLIREAQDVQQTTDGGQYNRCKHRQKHITLMLLGRVRYNHDAKNIHRYKYKQKNFHF